MTRRIAYTLMLISALSACAKAPPGAQSTVVIDIRNDLIPPAHVSVYLVPEAGIERLLGTVTSGRQTLQYRGLAPVGNHRLAARMTSGRAILSNVRVMDGVTGLEWVLMSNFLRVTATRNSGQ